MNNLEKEMKLIRVKTSFESEIRRCEAILSYIQDPIAKQGIELMIESLKKDIDLINDIERS
jgi:hypothetical protein